MVERFAPPGRPPGTVERRLERLRRASIDGERSGPSEPFDVDVFITNRRSAHDRSKPPTHAPRGPATETDE